MIAAFYTFCFMPLIEPPLFFIIFGGYIISVAGALLTKIIKT